MIMRIFPTGFMVTMVTCTQFLSAMEFNFQPLASLCRVEVNLSTSFGSGTIRGTFSKMSGNIKFKPENPQIARGTVILSSRSLRFGYPNVAYDAHIPEWLDSFNHPEISFSLQKLTASSWHGKELRTDAIGILKIKGYERSVSLPLSIQYFRNKRRKYEGKTGDLIRLQGMIILPRSQFGLAPGNMTEIIQEDITVRISITGASDRVRPFLPSRLFGS